MNPENADRIVSRIIANLTDRRGLRQEWEQIDAETKDEIRATWAQIVLNEANR